jgi:hypothetical protein
MSVLAVASPVLPSRRAGRAAQAGVLPSLLPGWTRGPSHRGAAPSVVEGPKSEPTFAPHEAAGTTGHDTVKSVNFEPGFLLSWARTGVETPEYASMQARAEEIEAGNGRVRCPPRARSESYTSATSSPRPRSRRMCPTTTSGMSFSRGKCPIRLKHFSSTINASRCPSERTRPLAHAISAGCGVALGDYRSGTSR